MNYTPTYIKITKSVFISHFVLILSKSACAHLFWNWIVFQVLPLMLKRWREVLPALSGHKAMEAWPTKYQSRLPFDGVFFLECHQNPRLL